MSRAKRDFLNHFIAYIIVNIFLSLHQSMDRLQLSLVSLRSRGMGHGSGLPLLREQTELDHRGTEKEIASIEYLARRREKKSLEQ